MPIWDAETMTCFDSWTNADLVRALDDDNSEFRDRYVTELAKRALAMVELDEKTARVQAVVAEKIQAILTGEPHGASV